MSIRHQRGLTIIELVMFMVIMGIAAAGIIGVLNLSTKSSADPLRRKQAMLIAEAYMEEVQLAGLTFCGPNDAAYGTALKVEDCGTRAAVGQRPPGSGRPYASVADYALKLNTPERTFAPNGVDLDVNGRALGADKDSKTMGNSSLAGITTTVTLNLLGPGAELGPNGASPFGNDGFRVGSVANNLEALQITVITQYGTNEFIRLDGYRTRYAP